jgi:hypothetical protein
VVACQTLVDFNPVEEPSWLPDDDELGPMQYGTSGSRQARASATGGGGEEDEQEDEEELWDEPLGQDDGGGGSGLSSRRRTSYGDEADGGGAGPSSGGGGDGVQLWRPGTADAARPWGAAVACEPAARLQLPPLQPLPGVQRSMEASSSSSSAQQTVAAAAQQVRRSTAASSSRASPQPSMRSSRDSGRDTDATPRSVADSLRGLPLPSAPPGGSPRPPRHQAGGTATGLLESGKGPLTRGAPAAARARSPYAAGLAVSAEVLPSRPVPARGSMGASLDASSAAAAMLAGDTARWRALAAAAPKAQQPLAAAGDDDTDQRAG